MIKAPTTRDAQPRSVQIGPLRPKNGCNVLESDGTYASVVCLPRSPAYGNDARQGPCCKVTREKKRWPGNGWSVKVVRGWVVREKSGQGRVVREWVVREMVVRE